MGSRTGRMPSSLDLVKFSKLLLEHWLIGVVSGQPQLFAFSDKIKMASKEKALLEFPM
jgi:hypothetical protein